MLNSINIIISAGSRLYYHHSCMCAQLIQSCLSLWDAIDCSPPGSSAPGILQARILKWVAMTSFRGSSKPRDQTGISSFPALVGGFFTPSSTREGQSIYSTEQLGRNICTDWASKVALGVKNTSAIARDIRDVVWSQGLEESLE